MVAVASLLVILTISMIINRVAAVALQLTGLSREVARFQARSAFSGAGFTTTEAEQIVNHPVRRRIVMMLMLVGNVGIVSVLGSVTLSFVTVGDESKPWFAWGIMAGGLATVFLISRSKWLDRRMCSIIAWALTKWTDLDARDYANLLHLSEGFGVLEARVGAQLAGLSIGEAQTRESGVLVLGVQASGGRYEGAPTRDRRLEAGEVVWLYGETHRVRALCDRGL